MINRTGSTDRIGNGIEPVDNKQRVSLPSSMVIPYKKEIDGKTSVQNLVDVVFPNIQQISIDPISMMNSVILTPKNDCVHEINDILINKFPGEVRKYTSIDKTIDSNDQGQYEDFLNSLEPNGLPPHELQLKKYVI